MMNCWKKKPRGYTSIDIEDPRVEDEQHPRDLVAFFICGLINNFGYVLMLSAAEDLMKDSGLSPPVVLLADILPSFLVDLIAPFFMAAIPYSIRVSFVVVMSISSFVFAALFSSVWLKLVGVVLGSIACGFGEITFLAYSSYYHKNTVSTWSSGTGGAGIFGSFSYVALKYLLAPKLILLVCSPVPLAIALSFFALMTKPYKLYQTQTTNTPTNSEPLLPKPKLSWSTKMRLMSKLLPFMIPLAIVYFAEYLINQATSPVLLFPNSSFSGKEYIYYQALYQIGVFISRSSVNLLPIKNIWLLQLPAVFQVINAIILGLDAVYAFIPSIYITFGIILWEGIMGGSIYVNTFYLMSQKFEGLEKEFCLGATSMSYGLSITLSAITGIFYNRALMDWRKLHSP
jgi:battenin